MKLLASLIAFSCFTESRKPNVIILNSDDFGIGDFQIYNREAKVPTPNIDRLGHEGVKFLNAHSGSSRCGPSRYMLMTGRYSMGESDARWVRNGEPHLGQMFQKAGYKTGVFGKAQPLPNWVYNTNSTWPEIKERKRLDAVFKEDMTALGGNFKNLFCSNWEPGIYEQAIKNDEYDYDYAFLHVFPCCQPGGYYENGYGVEPVDTWLRQMPYPEFMPEDTPIFNRERGMCSNELSETNPMTMGYLGPAGAMPERHNGNLLDLPIYYCHHAIQQIAMKSYDSRYDEERTIPKLEKFIDDHAEEPFMVYYGMRSGHGPFNTPERFRNKTEIGIVGEMIMETDELVGRVLARLEENGIDDNTLVMFMSDNGPSNSAAKIEQILGHNQRRLDMPDGTHVTLAEGKNTQGEAGHRTPFLWRLPSRFSQRTINDQQFPVSTTDVYATLAELIGYDLDCNEAPDSRSFLDYMLTGEPSQEIKKSAIMTHAYQAGNNASLRKNSMKYVPGNEALFDLLNDQETKNNLFNNPEQAAVIEHMDTYLNDWLQHIEKREAATQKGLVKDSCYPAFEHSNYYTS